MEINTKSQYIISNTHEHRNRLIVVEEYGVDKPKNGEIGFILDDLRIDFGEKNFRTFKYVCMYDNKFTNRANDEVFN